MLSYFSNTSHVINNVSIWHVIDPKIQRWLSNFLNTLLIPTVCLGWVQCGCQKGCCCSLILRNSENVSLYVIGIDGNEFLIERNSPDITFTRNIHKELHGMDSFSEKIGGSDGFYAKIIFQLWDSAFPSPDSITDVLNQFLIIHLLKMHSLCSYYVPSIAIRI